MGTYLIAEGVSADNNWLVPPRYWPWDLLRDYWLSEDSTTEDISGGR